MKQFSIFEIEQTDREAWDFDSMSKSELVQELKALYQPKGKAITASKDCCPFFRSLIKNKKQEHFMVLFFDGANQVIGQEVIFLGTINRSLVHPRELFSSAYKHDATSIILGHNHPSGNTQPSQADIEMTKNLMKASEILGIDILDHLIVTDTEHYSFHSNGILI